MFDLLVQRDARVLAEHRGEVVIELCVLVMQSDHRDADDWEDETQPSDVLPQFDGERVISCGGEVVEFGRRGRPPLDRVVGT